MEIKSKNIEGEFSIHRESSGVVKVSLRDKSSGIAFAEASLDVSDFTNALFGLHGVDANVEIKGLRYVGKKKEIRRVSLTVSTSELKKAGLSDKDRKKLEAFLVERHQQQGWMLSSYLGSQGSIMYVEGGVELNFSYYRYV